MGLKAVTLAAITWRLEFILIYFWGRLFLMNRDVPPAAIRDFWFM